MENSDGICHLYLSCFLKCGTTKSIKLDTSIQKAGLPWWLSSEESASQPANTGDMGSIPGLGRSPGVGNGNMPVFLPGRYHGQKSLAGYSPWGRKESDMTEAT